jgi:hypothetical protein
MNGIRTAGDVAAWLRVMDAVGVETSVVITDATGPEFDRQAKLLLAHPGRSLAGSTRRIPVRRIMPTALCASLSGATGTALAVWAS